MECCVRDCTMPREVGFRTCVIREHRGEEDARKLRGKRMKRRNQQGSSSTLQEGRVKGRFTRRWTHNEQLVVRPCGIVIGRATFYAAEAMTAVKVLSSL